MIITTRRSLKYRITPTKVQITTPDSQVSMDRLCCKSAGERNKTVEPTGYPICDPSRQHRLSQLKKDLSRVMDVWRRIPWNADKYPQTASLSRRHRKMGAAPVLSTLKKYSRRKQIAYPQFLREPSLRKAVYRSDISSDVYHRQTPNNRAVEQAKRTESTPFRYPSQRWPAWG